MHRIQTKYTDIKNNTYIDVRIRISHRTTGLTHQQIVRHVRPNKWLLQHFVDFRRWDYDYVLQLLIDGLQKLGQYIMTMNRFVGERKIGKRCLTASAYLKQAYYPTRCSTLKRMEQYTFKEDNKSKYMELIYTGNTPPGWDSKIYERRMYNLIRKKNEQLAKEQKKYAWNYLAKWLEYFWD